MAMAAISGVLDSIARDILSIVMIGYILPFVLIGVGFLTIVFPPFGSKIKFLIGAVLIGVGVFMLLSMGIIGL